MISLALDNLGIPRSTQLRRQEARDLISKAMEARVTPNLRSNWPNSWWWDEIKKLSTMLHPMPWLASTRLPWKSMGRKSHPQKSLQMALVYPNQIANCKTILVYGCGRVRCSTLASHAITSPWASPLGLGIWRSSEISKPLRPQRPQRPQSR